MSDLSELSARLEEFEYMLRDGRHEQIQLPVDRFLEEARGFLWRSELMRLVEHEQVLQSMFNEVSARVLKMEFDMASYRARAPTVTEIEGPAARAPGFKGFMRGLKAPAPRDKSENLRRLMTERNAAESSEAGRKLMELKSYRRIYLDALQVETDKAKRHAIYIQDQFRRSSPYTLGEAPT
ncbi:hypothetical protein P167DRAFT_352744 [Morchella conica CCBAS932]|uniref:Uncharacterized protein n=1 Tax=Morchella conica CCBAS932 TaxID=1392247 RepID=A0A3N4L018_9PEZI|nr:hypothetical protein P167DRAFT_352744 [Morchella conica CCBAS932]